MNFYVVLKIVHVLTAILGLGQVGALVVTVWHLPSAGALIGRITKIITASLPIMLLSGIGLMKMSGWAFAPTLWIRGSFFLMLVIGFSASRIIKVSRAPAHAGNVPTTLRRHGVTIAILTAVIVGLMTAKPF